MTHTREKTDIEKIRDLIKGIRVAMMTTIDQDGSLRSRPMATQETDVANELWFFTGADSAKAGEIGHDQRVNLSYSKPDDESYVSLSGTAKVVHDKAKAKELWNPFVKAWFPKGVDDPNLALVRVEVEKAEYWDAPSSKMVQLAGVLKAVVTGKQYDGGGENEKVNLK